MVRRRRKIAASWTILANAEICDDIDDIIANGADTLRTGASAADVVEPTAGFRAGSLMTKFGADGRVEAINLAWRCSLLALPEPA